MGICTSSGPGARPQQPTALPQQSTAPPQSSTAPPQPSTAPPTPVAVTPPPAAVAEKWDGPCPPPRGASVEDRVRYILDTADHVRRTGRHPPGDEMGVHTYSRWHMAWLVAGKVYDGDTLTQGTVLRVPLYAPPDLQGGLRPRPGPLVKADLIQHCPAKIRAYGYNSPEIRQATNLPEAEREANKRAAVAARTAFQSYCSGADMLEAMFVGDVTDVYGRCLCVLYLPDGTNINRRMAQEGYGVWFDGR
jgi:endonuclease YncB( thermonuclease family)